MNILYDNVALHQEPYVINTLNHLHSPDREIYSGTLARSRGAFILNTEHRTKIISVSGYIKANTAMELDLYIDQAKELFSREKKALDIDYSGSTRRYFATATNFKCDAEHWHITYVPFSVDFVVPDGIGINPTQRIHEVNGITTAEKSETVTIYGSTYPEYSSVITIHTAGGMTELSFMVGGNMITCSKIFANGDIIIIDSKNYSFSINGSNVQYNGMFPRLSTGQNTMIIQHDGISANYDVSLMYTPSYL